MPRNRNVYVLDPTEGGGVLQRSKSTDSVLQPTKHPEDSACVNPVLSVSCDTIDADCYPSNAENGQPLTAGKILYNRKPDRRKAVWCWLITSVILVVIIYVLAIILPLYSDKLQSMTNSRGIAHSTPKTPRTTTIPQNLHDTQNETSRIFLAQFTIHHVTNSVQSALRTSVTSLVDDIIKQGDLANIYRGCNISKIESNGNTVADLQLVFDQETGSRDVEDNLRRGLAKVKHKWQIDKKKISVKALRWPYVGGSAGGTTAFVTSSPGQNSKYPDTSTRSPQSSVPKAKGCASNQFECDNGQCIYFHQRCDLKPHCDDHSDEKNCTGECSRGRRKCSDGECIMAEWFCDGEPDCHDGSDEKNCGECQLWEFQCGDFSCVQESERCNGRPVCNDSSDEHHCVRIDASTGLTEVYHRGEWLSICAHGVTAEHGRMICDSLGRGPLEKFLSLPQSGLFQDVLHFVPSDIQMVQASLSKSSVCPSGRLLAITCARLECGLPTANILRPYIVHGNDAPPGKWPWQVSIRKLRRPLCGGVVLGPRHILTAAHCIEQLPNSPHIYDVVLGTTKSKTQDNEAVVADIQKMWMNPRYNNFSSGHDIAVIMLKHEIEFNDMIQPICLPRSPNDKFPITARCYATGWGFLDYHAKNNPNDLQEAKMQLWNTERCNSTEFYNGSLPWSTMCAGYISGYISICPGDSGGPLVCLDEHSRWRLVGITSFMASGCDVPFKPSVFTDVLKELSFIRDATSCQFTCDNGKCLYDESMICNREDNCGDNSDETRLCVASVNCTFEDKFLCGYVWEDKYSKLRWTRYRGDTPSADTGPSTDHNTGSGEGYYLYLEASTGKRDHYATLYTPAVVSNNTTCLQFHYHMYGAGVGRLDVLYYNGSHKWYRWSARGDQGNKWRMGQATLRPDANTPKPYKFQIWFRAFHSGSVFGDIALDDIRLVPHECPEFTCPADQYKCRTGNQCIDAHQECDVTKQCTDGSDEDHCNWSMSCDFQLATMCGYVNYQPNDVAYLWRRHRGKTLTDGTGPSRDHTYRNESGYYVYVDGRYGKVNSSVSLLSQPYEFQSLWCLRFYYHMNGDKYHMSKLHIFLRYAGIFYRMDVLHKRTGDRWRLYEKTFHPSRSADPSKKQLQIAFRAIRSNSKMSDIALDDLRVTDGACSTFSCAVGEFACMHSKECITGAKVCDGFYDCFYNEDETDCSDIGLDCNFDTVSRPFCNYIPDLTARARWHYTKHYTESEYTGPPYDHTTPERDGYYVYLEATGQLYEQDSARLLSPVKNYSQPYCLRFHYHMYGTGIGMLKVYVRRAGEELPGHWQIKGNQWNVWRYAQLTIPMGVSQQIVFEAIRGRTYRSDIAIDDIVVREGACPKFECPVDQYTCGNYKCISRHLVCDSYNDCSDYTDEIHCTCTASEFRCDMGMCIPLSQHCDSVTQCPDLSDEQGCHMICGNIVHLNITPPNNSLYQQLPYHDWKKASRQLLLNFPNNAVKMEITNTKPDLMKLNSLNENEGRRKVNINSNSCDMGYQQCRVGTCLLKDWFCDHELDCPDGSDEENCTTCSPSEFACSDFTCVPQSARCNDVTSCPDGSDEHGCFAVDEETNVLRVYNKHGFHPVCAVGWSDQYNQLICQKLGFQSADLSSTMSYDHATYATLDKTMTPQVLVSAFSQGPFCSQNRVVTLFCQPKECGQPLRRLLASPNGSGTEVPPGKWPWQASLLREGQYSCSAALVNREILVTAAKCFAHMDTNPSAYSAILGSTKNAISPSDSHQMLFGVKKVVLHKDFTQGLKHDIALVLLDRPVNYSDYARPVCLPAQNSQPPSSVCYSSGWGRSDDSNDMPKTLQESKMRLYSLNKCNSTMYWDGTIEEGTMCAGHDPAYTSVCTADSGGPLVCVNEYGHWTLAGITSLIDTRGCTEHAKPNAYTQVSAYRAWIRQTLPCAFRCTADLCLYNRDLLCNGVPECPGGQDEAPEVCTVRPTQPMSVSTEKASLEASTCSLDDTMFDCGNSTCVGKQYYCDGLPQCPRGEDEPENCRCSDDQFTCENGQCIHAQGLCNSLAECWDLSDENKCNCSEGEFRCASGVCKPLHQRCDGVNHCLDFSDEMNCTCVGADKYHCDNGVCISQKKLCNSYDDCGDLSDEWNCACDPASQFECNGGMCIQREWRCDGYSDCDDGSDEGDCERCVSGEFSCRDYSCRPASARCNGLADCSDNSDEDRCFEFRPLGEGGVLVVHAHRANAWLPVCSSGWLPAYSDRVCQHLGFGASIRTSFVPSDGSSYALSAAANTSLMLQGHLLHGTCESGRVVSVVCGSKDCGQPSPRLSFADTSIVGGRVAQAGEWPWMAAVYYLDKFLCGATLINQQWVLTVAHCFHNNISILPHNVKVVLGTTNSRQPSAHAHVMRVRQIVLHPEFRESPLPVNDVALVMLKSPVPRTDYIRPICIQSYASMFGLTSHCFVAGWGISQVSTRTTTDRLRVAKMRLWPNVRCDETIGKYYDNRSMICARYDTGYVTACSGDSGGPLQCLDANRKWTLTGVLSFGTDCSTINRQGETKPDIYANATFYLPWIKETLKLYDTPTK